MSTEQAAALAWMQEQEAKWKCSGYQRTRHIADAMGWTLAQAGAVLAGLAGLGRVERSPNNSRGSGKMSSWRVAP